MAIEKKEKDFRFLIPVEKIPPGPVKTMIYDNILQEFIQSRLKYAEVKDIGKKPATMAMTLKRRLKERHIENIKVTRRKEKVYLARLE